MSSGKRSESAGFLCAIQCPALIANARDDPPMTPAVLPTAPQFWPERHLAGHLDRTVAG